MNIKWYDRIQVQISTVYVVVAALFLVAICMYSYTSGKKSMHDEMDRVAKSATSRLASNLGEVMARPDKYQIKNQIEKLIEIEMMDERIDTVIVKKFDESLFVGRERDTEGRIVESIGAAKDENLRKTNSIFYESIVLGSVELYIQPSFMTGELKRSVISFFVVAAGLNVLIIIALLIVLRKSIINPMRELIRVTENISMGKLEEAISIRSNNELGHLGDAIERMRLSIRIAMKRVSMKKKSVSRVDVKEWVNVIMEKKNYGFEFLALRILVGRLGVSYRNDPTQETMKRCIHQLINFFQNEKNPQAQKDLYKIIGGGAL